MIVRIFLKLIFCQNNNQISTHVFECVQYLLDKMLKNTKIFVWFSLSYKKKKNLIITCLKLKTLRFTCILLWLEKNQI